MKKYNLIDCIYEKRKVEEEDLEIVVNQIKNKELIGVNVTVPFKKKIIPLLDSLDDVADYTQSVNTLVYHQNDLRGYNTDALGFRHSFTKDPAIEYKDRDIFIIGSGGVTPSIVFNFILSANKIYITNRTKEKAEQLKDKDTTGKVEIIDWGEKPKVCDMVINTTSVGLIEGENLGLDFKDYDNNKKALFYDIIYKPKETNFLKNARLRGNKTMNGKMMFLNQALLAFQKWTGVYPEIDNEVIKLLDE